MDMLTRLSLIFQPSSGVPSHDVGGEQVSLPELNNLLEVLSDVFPEHQVVLLRELLLNASQESRLHIAANAVIQNPQRYAQSMSRLRPGRVEDWEKFRSAEYKNTVGKLLVTEFQDLAQSTVRNVLLENNYDYVRGRMALCDIASKSWRFKFAAWISRKKAPPLRPSLDVANKSTGCALLDDEIYALGRPERDAQSLRDEQVARDINEDEYSKAHALVECGCCFGDYTWEDLTVCTEGHFFCRGCLDRSVKEALYGQGSCLFREKGSVRCISSVAAPACEGFVAHMLLPHVLPSTTMEKVEQWFAREQLQSSGLPLVRCPACSYAAVDNPMSPRLRPWAMGVLGVMTACVCIQLPLWLYVTQFMVLHLSYCVLAILYAMPMGFSVARAWIRDAMTRVRRRQTGVRTIFKCENPRCGVASCIDCGKEWVAFHDCRQDALDNRRLFVERAMSEAVKRTCPRCHTSFVKSDGCNMLTCPCGYEMCYVCRADVHRVRYGHFCQHFRLVPGAACTTCDQCNLYETEDEQAVAMAAARRAGEEWATRVGGSANVQSVKGMPTEPLAYAENTWSSWMGRHLEYLIDVAFEW